MRDVVDDNQTMLGVCGIVISVTWLFWLIEAPVEIAGPSTAVLACAYLAAVLDDRRGR